MGRSGREFCDLKMGQVRLHDPSGSRLRIPDAKTEAGIREVVSPVARVGELTTADGSEVAVVLDDTIGWYQRIATVGSA